MHTYITPVGLKVTTQTEQSLCGAFIYFAIKCSVFGFIFKASFIIRSNELERRLFFLLKTYDSIIFENKYTKIILTNKSRVELEIRDIFFNIRKQQQKEQNITKYLLKKNFNLCAYI